MPNLGKKFECFNCRAKFYDLGKPEAICPKCGANQRDARAEESAAAAPRPRRMAPIVVAPDEVSEFEDHAHEEEEETIDQPGYAEEEEFDDEEPPLETHEREEEEDF
jgi:hypothetical protein